MVTWIFKRVWIFVRPTSKLDAVSSLGETIPFRFDAATMRWGLPREHHGKVSS
jgi:hypothetical protein